MDIDRYIRLWKMGVAKAGGDFQRGVQNTPARCIEDIANVVGPEAIAAAIDYLDPEGL